MNDEIPEAMECEFCEIDGLGNHAPRCPVQLEKEIANLRAKLADAERKNTMNDHGTLTGYNKRDEQARKQLVSPLTDKEQSTMGNMFTQYALNFCREIEDKMHAAIARAEAEKSRRVAYQTIVYSVCNLLDTATGSKIVCGDGDNPTREVQDTVTVLIKSRDELRREVEALKANNNPPQ